MKPISIFILCSFLALLVDFPVTVRAQSKTGSTALSSVVDPTTGIVHNGRLNSGVPLGGLGAGAFQLETDGTVGEVALFSGGEPVPALPGCFAALWTRAGDKTDARLLSLQNPYHLPHVSALDYDGLFPQALLTCPGNELPLTVGLRAFSPLIPHDIKNSAYPAACFLFHLKNPLTISVEVSVALSWESVPGMDGQPTRKGMETRTIPSGEGYFGVSLGRPAPAATGTAPRMDLPDEMTLMTLPPRPQAVVTTAGWNARDTPGWWEGFRKEGKVSGGAVLGKDEQDAPAGVIAVRLMLKPGDAVDIPFTVAWYTHRLHHDDGAYYQRLWPDATQTARALLSDWISLFALTEEWQKRLTYSNLPVWMHRRLINSLAPLSTHSVYTLDGRFALWSRIGTSGSRAESDPAATHWAGEDAVAQLAAFPALLTFFPDLAAQQLTQLANAPFADGSVSTPSGPESRETALGPPRRLESTGAKPKQEESPEGGDASKGTSVLPARKPLSVARQTPAIADGLSVFLLQWAYYVFWTGDTDLALQWHSQIRHALDALLEVPNEVLPPSATSLKQAALAAGQRLLPLTADAVGAARARDGLKAMVAYRQQKQWARNKYFVVAGDGGDGAQQLGLWAENSLDLATPLPDPKDMLALQSVQQSAIRALNLLTRPYNGATGISAPDKAGDVTDVGTWPALLLGDAALSIWMDTPEVGMEIWQKLETWHEDKLRSPWEVPSHLTTISGQGPSALEPGLLSRQPGTEKETTLAAMSDWNLLAALEGVAWDGVAQRLTLAPNIPGTWRSLIAPVFMPGFWARLEFHPLAHGGVTTFRLDRITATGAAPAFSRLQEGAELIVKSLHLLGPTRLASRSGNAIYDAHISLGSRSLGARVERNPAGDLILTFDTPLRMTAGDRLEIDVH